MRNESNESEPTQNAYPAGRWSNVHNTRDVIKYMEDSHEIRRMAIEQLQKEWNDQLSKQQAEETLPVVTIARRVA